MRSVVEVLDSVPDQRRSQGQGQRRSALWGVVCTGLLCGRVHALTTWGNRQERVLRRLERTVIHTNPGLVRRDLAYALSSLELDRLAAQARLHARRGLSGARRHRPCPLGGGSPDGLACCASARSAHPR
jgi:hypothetical protein